MNDSRYNQRRQPPALILAAFYLALGALLCGIAALFAPLVAESGWWQIAVIIFSAPGLSLTLTALGIFAAALYDLWQGAAERRHAVDHADAEAEAAYWLAVARAAQLGISVPGYLRHAGWSEEAIAELEIRTGRDVDSDGRIGAPEPPRRGFDYNAAVALLRWCYLQDDGDFGQVKGRAAFPDTYDEGMKWLARRGLILGRTRGEMGRLAYDTWAEASLHLSAAWTPIDMSSRDWQET